MEQFRIGLRSIPKEAKNRAEELKTSTILFSQALLGITPELVANLIRASIHFAIGFAVGYLVPERLLKASSRQKIILAGLEAFLAPALINVVVREDPLYTPYFAIGYLGSITGTIISAVRQRS